MDRDLVTFYLADATVAECSAMANNMRKTAGRMASKGFPNPVDIHVGSRIRVRRTILGLSQTTLAEQMGLTFQQVQKYERADNRVSSSRLFDLCRILGVKPAYFFAEMGSDVAGQSPGTLQGLVPKLVDQELDPAAKRETLEFVRAFGAITDEVVRRSLVKLIRSVAED